jgi:hypothetical protein
VEGQLTHHLTKVESEERRYLGLCYNCDEKFSHEHNRVCKRIFLLDNIIEDDSSEGAAGDKETREDETPHFSLHTIVGVYCGATMQVRVSVVTIVFTTLLDFGSTHNFIIEDMAHRTGLPLLHHSCLMATVANGERVTCPGVIKRAPLTINNDMFYVDLSVMPLTGYDLVLRTKWLATLGPVLWDFSAQNMSFQRKGHTCAGQGDDAQRTRHPDDNSQRVSYGRDVSLLHGRLRQTHRTSASARPRPQHHPKVGCATSGSLALQVSSIPQGRVGEAMCGHAGTRQHSS